MLKSENSPRDLLISTTLSMDSVFLREGYGLTALSRFSITTVKARTFLSSNILPYKSHSSKDPSHCYHKVTWLGFQQIIEPKDTIVSDGLFATFISLLWNSQKFCT